MPVLPVCRCGTTLYVLSTRRLRPRTTQSLRTLVRDGRRRSDGLGRDGNSLSQRAGQIVGYLGSDSRICGQEGALQTGIKMI